MSYRRKHVKNKIYNNRPKKSIFKMPIFWYSLLVLIIVGTGFYFLLFFPNFQVNNITINGNQKISSENLKNIVDQEVNKKPIGFAGWNLYSKSIFLVNTEELQKQILNTYSEIKIASVTKNLPQDLAVNIEERKQFAIFCQNEKCFNIDEGGVIFENSSTTAQDTFIVRQNINLQDAFVGENVIEENIMRAISKIEKDLKGNFQINLAEALISTPIRLDVKTGEGWQIYFNIDTDSDIGLQLTKLNLLLKDEIASETRQKLEYVDLRFKDRAYYK